MNIQLVNTRVESLDMKFSADGMAEDNFSLSYANGFSEDDDKLFIIKFDVSLESTHGYLISLRYIAEFTSNESIGDGFRDSPFLVVNAPAIAYPYLRSFLSVLTLSSGYTPVFLPTINFQALANEKKQNRNQQ